eukprot:TRINITY_DN110628_c0_g1_i1.p1 TRINITY_DN110628_c0_g1~~TRINITY_DN110628_c0_g1_i1.p1  ORF type:complete len:205 (-),score=34.86 TRINITY_DN110628_c0_g1_i1:145-759(-)
MNVKMHQSERRGSIDTTDWHAPGDSTPEWGTCSSAMPEELHKKLMALHESDCARFDGSKPRCASVDDGIATPPERSGSKEAGPVASHESDCAQFDGSRPWCASKDDGMATPTERAGSKEAGISSVTSSMTPSDWDFVANGSTGWAEQEVLGQRPFDAPGIPEAIMQMMRMKETQQPPSSISRESTLTEEDMAKFAVMDSGWSRV